MKFSRKIWIGMFIPFLIVSLATLIGCNSDDEVENSGSGTFTPDTTDPASNSIYLALDSQDNNTITLAVKAKDLSNVYGIWFNLDFDGSIFSYSTASEGDFLKQGNPTFFFATGKTSTVVVGVTRQGEASGVSGSGTICKLTFSGIEEGTSRFDFSLNSAADPNGNLIPGISWHGGSAAVVL